MADEDGVMPRGNDAPQEVPPRFEFRMELCGSLPGGRAVVGVEKKGEFTLLASEEHVSAQARDELVEQLSRIAVVQDWPGR